MEDLLIIVHHNDDDGFCSMRLMSEIMKNDYEIKTICVGNNDRGFEKYEEIMDMGADKVIILDYFFKPVNTTQSDRLVMDISQGLVTIIDHHPNIVECLDSFGFDKELIVHENVDVVDYFVVDLFRAGPSYYYYIEGISVTMFLLMIITRSSIYISDELSLYYFVVGVSDVHKASEPVIDFYNNELRLSLKGVQSIGDTSNFVDDMLVTNEGYRGMHSKFNNETGSFEVDYDAINISKNDYKEIGYNAIKENALRLIRNNLELLKRGTIKLDSGDRVTGFIIGLVDENGGNYRATPLQIRYIIDNHYNDFDGHNIDLKELNTKTQPVILLKRTDSPDVTAITFYANEELSNVDYGKLCSLNGGGGHRSAAGCKVHTPYKFFANKYEIIL